MKYFIIIPDETAWRLDVEYFVHQLSLRWSSIKVNRFSIPESIYLLDWRVVEGGQSVGDGALNKNRRTVTFSGLKEYLVNFALWYRSLVPETESLIFFHESYSGHFSLTADMSKEQIMDML